MTWIFWFAWLFALAIATVVYSAYRRDVAVARARTLSASRILRTRCGRIEYASLGQGSPVLVLHGTSGLGVLNEGNAQGSARQYPLERISAPTLLISAADDLYRTLPNARHAASRIPHARVIEFSTGGHLLLGHDKEMWREVAGFLEHAARERYTAA